MEENVNAEPVSKLQEFLVEVKTDVSKCLPAVVEALKKKMLEEEVASRVSTLEKALSLSKSLRSELGKIKPDIENFTSEGEVVRSFSKGVFETKKKLGERVQSIDKVINDFLVEGDHQKLKQAVDKLSK